MFATGEDVDVQVGAVHLGTIHLGSGSVVREAPLSDLRSLKECPLRRRCPMTVLDLWHPAAQGYGHLA